MKSRATGRAQDAVGRTDAADDRIIRRVALAVALSCVLLAGLPALALAEPPSNDSFAAPLDLSAESGPRTGSTREATAEPGEPAHNGQPARHSVWFRYTAGSSGRVQLNSCGSDFDTVLAVYRGTALSNLGRVVSNDDGSGCPPASDVEFEAEAGTTYLIALDGYSSDSGDYKLSVGPPPPSVPSNDSRDGASYLAEWVQSGDTSLATAEPGEPAHAGEPASHSVWFEVYAGTTAPVVVDACGSDFPAVLAAYEVGGGGELQELAASRTQSCGSGQQGTRLRFRPPAAGSYLIALDGIGAASGRYLISAITNDDRAGAAPLYPNYTQRFSNVAASTEPGEPAHAGDPGGHSLWFAFQTGQASPGSTITIDTCSTFSSGLDTVLAVYAEGLDGLYEVASNDDSLACGAGGGGSRVEFVAPAGVMQLLVAVDGKGGAVGSFDIATRMPPRNDNRVNAEWIASTQASVFGDTRGATKEAGEPHHAGNAGGHSIWYRWTPTSDEPAEFTTCELDPDGGPFGYSGFDTLLAVYVEGQSGLEAVAANDDAPDCAGGGSRVAFDARADTSYFIAVDGRDGSQGFMNLRRRFAAANDDFEAAQPLSSVVLGTTRLATAQPGEPDHAGSPASQSVWYRFDAQSWMGSTLSISTCHQSTEPTRIAVYRGTSLDSLEPVASGVPGRSNCASGRGARARWSRASATTETYWVAVDAAGSTDADFAVASEAGPANDSRAHAEASFGDTLTAFGSNVAATHEPGELDHGGAGGVASLWYEWTPETSGSARVDTCRDQPASTADTVVAVYTETDGELEALAQNDDTAGCGSGRQSRVTFDATGGERYVIVVDSRDGEEGSFTLRALARVANDNRADAIAIEPGAEFVYGTLETATREAGEPDHAGVPGGRSVWYRLTPIATAPLTIDACGYYPWKLDTLLAVYTVGDGGLTEIAADDNSGGCAAAASSRVTFNAVEGTEYLIAVDSRNGAEGDFYLRLPPRNDHFKAGISQSGPSFSWSGQLGFATAESGEPDHAGVPAARSVWFAWTPNRSALATIDTCDFSSSGTRLAAYTGESVESLTAVAGQTRSACPTGSGQRLRFEAEAGQTYHIALDSSSGSTSYSLRARLGPANDRLANATNLGTAASAVWRGTTTDAGREPGEPDHAAAGGAASVWYRWTPAWSGTARFDTCSSPAFDSAVAIYTQQASGVAGLRQEAANDDADGCGDGTQSRARMHVDAGTTYYIAVDGHGDASGEFDLRIALGPVNDDFSGALTLSAGQVSGTTVDAGEQAGEPNHGGLLGDRSVWYRFSIGDARNVELRACPQSGADTPALAVYSGTSLLDLMPQGTTGTRTVDGVVCRTVTLRGVSGQRFVAVDGSTAGVEGRFALTLAIAPANDDRARATNVLSRETSGTTAAATREPDEPEHAAASGGRSVWYRWTAAVSGPVTIDTCAMALDTLLAIYTEQSGTLSPVASSDDMPGCGSGGSRVRFSAVLGREYLIAVDGKAGAEGPFVLGFSPSNDLFSAAQARFGEVWTHAGTTARAGDEPGEPAHGGDSAARSVWYTWTPPRSGRAQLSTCLGSSTRTRIALYDGTEISALTPVAAAGASPGCASGSGAIVRTRVTGGTTYRIAVDGDTDGAFTLQAALTPPNDDRIDAIDVGAGQVVTASSTFATAEADEPARAGHPGAASVWYRFTADSDGPVSLKTCGSTFATVLGAYDTSNGTLQEVGASDDAPGRCAQRAGLEFTASAGSTYLIAVDGRNGASGAFRLAVGTPANDDIQDAAVLSGPSDSGQSRADAATVQDDDPAAVAAAGRSLWWSWTAPSTGPVEINTCGSASSTRLGVYRGTPGALVHEVSAAFSSGCGGRSRLTLDAVAGRTYLLAVAGASDIVRIQVGPPANDRFAGAQALSGLSDSATGTTKGASTEDFEPQHDPDGRGRTLWYSWTAPDTGILALDTCSSASPLHVALYTGSAISSLLRVDADESDGSCSPAAPGRSRSYPVIGGVTYHIAVDAADDTPGATLLRLRLAVDTVPPETTIDDGPPEQTRDATQTFSFSANEAEATFECRVDGDDFASCGSPYARSDISEGAHTFQVRATDKAGNIDPTPAERPFTVDWTPPDVTIDDGPADATRETSATIAFSSRDATARFECSWDDAELAPCTSPSDATGLQDGEHNFRVRAIDLAGNETIVTRAFTVDRVAPTTTMSSTPRDPTNEVTPTLWFYSDDGATFACSIDDATFAPCESPLEMSGLGEGDHTVRVLATDRAGNVETTPASHTFEIDRTPPETTITGAPSAPFHEGETFDFESSEDGYFECAIDERPYELCSGSPHVIDLIGIAPGDHMFRVRSIDAAGNVDETPAEAPFTSTNRMPEASLDVSPDGGAANLDVEAIIDASDGDADQLDYEIDFGDGARETGQLPRTDPIEHTYTKAGQYVVRLEVSDGYESDVQTRTVAVVLPEPLAANAGDDQVAIAGEPVQLDGAGSRPLIGIERYRWDFGDGTGAEGAVREHVYTTPGTYEATLTTEAGLQSDSDAATVQVLPESSALGVLVTVTSGGSPLSGADVLVVTADGQRVAAVSDNAGRARLRGLPDGEYKVLAYKSGHLPASVTTTVRDGVGEAAVELRSGDVAKAELDSRRLSRDEILALGIDPNDPANQHTYEFTVNLQVTDPPGGGGGGAGGGGGFVGGNGFIGPGIGGLTCRRLVCKGTVRGATVTVTYHELAPGVPGLTTLVIPFRARWLKEFFDVSMTVHNLADSGFTLRNGTAMLDLPPGLSLPQTARGERLTVPVGDIPGGGEATANWIVRGDREGEYQLGAAYGATLEPFGRSVSIRAATEDPLKVWGGSALRLVVETDDAVRNGYPFTVHVGLENVSDIPVYNAGVELLEQGRQGYIEQPRQQGEFTRAEIAPGATFNAGPFILVPEASGDIDLGRSFVKKTGGDVDLQTTIKTKSRVPSFEDTPKVSSHARMNAVVVKFDPIVDASDYEVYATPDRETDFPETPLHVRDRRPGKLIVDLPPGQPRWLAVSTKRPGRNQEMIHALAREESSSTEIWPRIAASPGSCGDRNQQVTVEMEDEDYDLRAWRYKVGDEDWSAPAPISGPNRIERIRVTPIDDRPTTVLVQAQNEEQAGTGAWGPTASTIVGRCNLTAIGDSISAGEGIGYGYEWNNTTERWEDKNGSDESWLDKPRPASCHQTPAAHPRVIADDTGMTLTHLSCTGATFYEGIAGKEPKKGIEHEGQVEGPQVGGFDGKPDTNETYRTSDPDVVLLSLGANDINFGDVVGSCYFEYNLVVQRLFTGECDENLDTAIDRLESDDVRERFRKTYARIREIANTRGRGAPLVLQTEYINPFPASGEDQSCVDISGGTVSPFAFSRDRINTMVRGLTLLNKIIREEASKAGVIAVPASPEFEDHRFCSDDPWIYGMDTALDLHRDLAPKQESPFHPTPAGQAAIAKQVESYMTRVVRVEETGSNIPVVYAGGERIRFTDVLRPGQTLVVETPSSQLPEHRNFFARQGYQIDTSAEYSGPISVTLPAQAGDKMWHFHDGTWEDVHATFDGKALQGSVTSLSPFAVGPEVPAVNAVISGGEGGVVPKEVSFSATASTGPVDSVSWDFGDGTSGTGTQARHEYTYSGTYEVTATVRSAAGAESRATKTVEITNPGPSFAGTLPQTLEAGQELVLDSTASTDPNGSIKDGWWQLDDEPIEPMGQRTTITIDEPGVHTVVGFVRDEELKVDSKTFTVTVTPRPDRAPPVISDVPSNQTLEATSPAGAVATYTKPTATDTVDGDRPVTCAPASGSMLPLGSTEVSCAAEDASGNRAEQAFTIVVRDTTPPVFEGVPASVSATAPYGSTAVGVSFPTPTASDTVSGARPVTCTPASGAQLPVGRSTVTCSAKDAAGNGATASFPVEVTAGTPETGDSGSDSGHDTRAPLGSVALASKQSIRTLVRKGLRLTVSCDETCTAAVKLYLDRKAAKKLKLRRLLARVEATVAAGGKRSLAVKLPVSARGKLKRLKKLKLVLNVTAVDGAGNRATVVGGKVLRLKAK